MKKNKLLKIALVLIPLNLLAVEGIIKKIYKVEDFDSTREKAQISRCITNISTNIPWCTYQSAPTFNVAESQASTVAQSAISNYGRESTADIINDINNQINDIDNNEALSQSEKNQLINSLEETKKNIALADYNDLSIEDSVQGIIPQGTSLSTQDGAQMICSVDKSHCMSFQKDGNMVMYENRIDDSAYYDQNTYETLESNNDGDPHPGPAVNDSGALGSSGGPYSFDFQDFDGHLVLYDGNNNAVKATGVYDSSYANTDMHVEVTNNGNLIQKDGNGNTIWTLFDSGDGTPYGWKDV